MAETTYKKGELLLDETVVTSLEYNFVMGTCQTQMFLNQEVLIIDFNGVEYECEANNYESQHVYGGFSLTTTTPDFSIYPFVICNMMSGASPEEAVITDTINLFTENPGTYSLKIYTAISDSDSSSEPVTIRSYIDKNLANLNWNILPQIFESEGVELTEEIERYLRETPKNTNWNVFGSLGSTVELPHKIYFRYWEGVELDTDKSTLKTAQEIQNWVVQHEGQNIEFYIPNHDDAMVADGTIVEEDESITYKWIHDEYDQTLYVGANSFHRNVHD